MARKIYITIGLPGSGKSTWAQYMTCDDSNNKIVSGDAIREMLAGRYHYDRNLEYLIDQIKRSCIESILGFSSSNIIIDDVHGEPKYRKYLCDFIREMVNDVSIDEARPEIFYVVFKSNKSSLISNRKIAPKGLNPHIWNHVIDKLSKNMVLPSSDEIISMDVEVIEFNN